MPWKSSTLTLKACKQQQGKDFAVLPCMQEGLEIYNDIPI